MKLRKMGFLAVGKNALQRSGIKTISKQEFKKASYLSMINYARWGEYFITSYAPTRIPEAAWAGIGDWIASNPREQIKDTYYFFKKGIINTINSIQEINTKERK